MMAEHSSRNEVELASGRNENLQRCLESKRLISILLAGAFFLIAGMVGFWGFAMATFCLIVLGLICFVRYFDANSHLHEIRRRSAKTLAPHLSVLKQEDPSASPDPGQPFAHG